MANEKRLIDANAVIKEIDNYYNNSPFPHPGTSWRRGFEFAAGLALNAPTVDAVEVVHGYNIDRDTPSLFECSVCHWSCWDTYCGDTADYNYCPNCGAKMDGDGNA